MMMVTEREIREYKKRRAARIMERVARFDAAQRLAYGLAKKYGIDTKGMSPKEVWEAIKGKTGKEARDFYNQSGNAGADKIKFGTANKKSFTKALNKAKASQNPKNAWRVTGMDSKELMENHPKAKLHVTDGGSTIALDSGDIVGVCKKKGDSMRGSDLLAFAVKNGGNRLDSYAGNHDFYASNGFEAISWCEWDSAYEDDAKKQGWNPDEHDREPIIFYKYVGKGNVKNTNIEDFKKSVKASANYGEAMAKRDAEV